MIYIDLHGAHWSFNDCVTAQFCIAEESIRNGRLVQVRKGVGQFGTDMYFFRLADGSIRTWENTMLVKCELDIPPGTDSGSDEYTIRGEWPETGFVITQPKQPKSDVQSFAMRVTKSIQPAKERAC